MNSFDPDHALAIILQAKFNEEAKKKKQKEKENRPVGVSLPATKTSLVDPEWEVTDPCPDIHGLFLAFNDRFFWGRLVGIEVKWSPQMTSCAGVCVYEGHNGLCSVRLSAPLLKLRPRSDLVETLLHEMIHAYLFVTHNNRDRDGHGPEFHKHMNRINHEAGTNITVYHSFHAEVKLYQQHWWRCDGPCQKKPPFFGMVKRAKNRAPGPNDFWWADHQAACGGHFLKIREPEGYGAKGKAKGAKAVKPKEGKDIRNFFKKPLPASVNGSSSSSSIPSTSGKVGSNVFGFKNFTSSQPATGSAKPSNGSVNRVVGFGDLSSNGSRFPTKTPPRMNGNGNILGGAKGKNTGKPSTTQRGGVLANRGGGTLVVSGTKTKSKSNETPPDSPKSPNTKLRIDNFKVFSGSGFTLGGGSDKIDRSKSRLLSLGNGPDNKRQKTDAEVTKNHQRTQSCDDLISTNDKTKDLCKCSVCNKSMPREEIEGHMECCEGLRNVFNDSNVFSDGDVEEINEINKKSKITSCPVCALNVEGDINVHLDDCLNTSGILNIFDQPYDELSNKPSTASSDGFDQPTVMLDSDSPILIQDWKTRVESPIVISDSDSPLVFHNGNVHKPKIDYDSDLEIIEPENRVACMICGMRFGESRINAHVNECLDSNDE